MAEISSLDLHYLVLEAKQLEGARVDRIVQPSNEEVLIGFFVAGKGKVSLRIAVPGFFYITPEKPEAAGKVFGFCAALRKYLSNARLEKVEQVGSERVAKLSFISKEGAFALFAEMFAKGNMILCRKDLTVIVPALPFKSKDREIKAGSKYSFPSRDIDFFKLSLKDVKSSLKNQSQPISKALAVEFGFGGAYAKEICIMAGIGLQEKEIDDARAKAIFESIKSITGKKPSPQIVYGNGSIKAAAPFGLDAHKGMRSENAASLSSAWEALAKSGMQKKQGRHEKEIARLQKMISMQEENISHLEESAAESAKKGELIYENYQLLKKILDEISMARKEYGWKYIKEKLKGHKIIKEVNEKTGEIVVEI